MTNSKKPAERPGSQTSRYEPERVDLTQFASLDEALTIIDPKAKYSDLAALIVPVGPEGMPLTLLVMFWQSMISRSEGLHQAIVREARRANPHAVFPLIRALAEALVVVMYVQDHPDYVNALTVRASEIPKGSQRRKTMQALINYALKQRPGMKMVYAELSEATHFGATAMWMPHSIESEEERLTSWSSGARWRSDEEALIACAWTLELADAMEIALRQFAERYVLPLRDRGLMEDQSTHSCEADAQ
ncbi:MAG: hypothetical protein WB507_01795 [Solirubrobacterales bacterium]